jgi:DNA topoisomerase-2
MGSIGLRLGEAPENLRYGKILIFTDADADGDAITGLIINLFARFWPELFENGNIYKVLTPLVVAKKGKETISFYTKEEYKEWESNATIKGWSIEYKKGLAALENSEYESIIKNPKAIQIGLDSGYKESLHVWFGNDSSLRKEKLLKK